MPHSAALFCEVIMLAPSFVPEMTVPVFAAPSGLAICVGIPILLLFAVLGAVILRSSCHITSVKVPEFGKAFGTIIFAGLAILLTNAILLVGVTTLLGNDGLDPANWSVASVGILGVLVSFGGFVINFLVTSAVYMATLEISFLRGMLVNLVWYVIAFFSLVGISLFAAGVTYLSSLV